MADKTIDPLIQYGLKHILLNKLNEGTVLDDNNQNELRIIVSKQTTKAGHQIIQKPRLIVLILPYPLNSHPW